MSIRVEGWVDHFQTWQRDLKKKHEAGQDLRVDLMTGLLMVADAVGRVRRQGPTGHHAAYATSLRRR